MNAPIHTEDAFHRLIHENHMYGLWEIASQMTPHPRPEAVPYQWKWSLLEQVAKQSAGAVPVGDERRAMQLFNPGLNGQWATTSTLIAAVQVLLPGEVARAPPLAGGHPLHHPGQRRLYRGRGREGDHARGRPDPHAELAVARPRQRDRRNRGVDGRPGRAAHQGAELHLLPDARRGEVRPVQARERLQGAVRPWAPGAQLGEGAPALLAADALLVRPDHGGARRAEGPRGLALRGHRARVHPPADRRTGDADHRLPHPDAAPGREA